MTSNAEANGSSPAHDTSAASGAPQGDELRETIGHTREQLGQTIEELAAKTHVKDHVQAKAADVKVHLHDATADVAAHAQEKAAHAAHAAQTAAAQAKEQLGHMATALTQKLQDTAPAKVRAAVERRGPGSAAWLPWAVAGVAVGALVGLAACRRAGGPS